MIVVGAGLSGLIAARQLNEAGFAVQVIDQARRVGGRLATRYIGQSRFDYGAQFFTARSKRFGVEIQKWLEIGLVSEWCRGFGEPDGYPRYRVNGGMVQLAKHLATPLEVRTGCRVSSIIPLAQEWALTFDQPELEPIQTDAVVMACPVPLALDMLRTGGAVLDAAAKAKAQSFSYHRVLALLITLDHAPYLGSSGARQQHDHPVFSFIADNQKKGISETPALTLHLTHAATEIYWKTKDGDLRSALAEELTAVLGQAKITGFWVHRWRFAGPVEPSEEASLLVATKPGPAVLCGDAFAGAKVEGAYLSGLEAAERCAQSQNPDPA